MTHPAPDLAERYGTTSHGRRPVVVVAVALLAVAALAWVVWVVLFHGRPLVQSELVRFDEQGEHAAVAEYTVVRRDRDVTSSCLLRAFADDHSVVGELNVEVDSSQAATATMRSTVRTERKATSVELVGCTAEGQSQRR